MTKKELLEENEELREALSRMKEDIDDLLSDADEGHAEDDGEDEK